MARQLLCDICKKPTTAYKAKLLYIPVSADGRTTHSEYKYRADVGVCCAEKMLDLFNFQARQTRKEYNDRRKAGVG